MIRRIGISKEIAISGGVGYNPGFKEALMRELKLEEVLISDAPEYGAAVGAAVVAAEWASVL